MNLATLTCWGYYQIFNIGLSLSAIYNMQVCFHIVCCIVFLVCKNICNFFWHCLQSFINILMLEMYDSIAELLIEIFKVRT